MPTEEKDSAASADENLAKKNVWYKKLKTHVDNVETT
jgi:hypothetical protein